MRCAEQDLLLYAVTDRHWLSGRSLRDVVEESLRGGATLGGASAPAYNCTRCKKIILDYSVRHLSP